MQPGDQGLGSLALSDPLAAVVRRGSREVPPQAEDVRRRRDQAGEAEAPVQGDQATDGEHHGDRRADHRRHHRVERPADRSDVVTDPAHQVADAGLLHALVVEVQDVVDDLFAELGQRGLGGPGQGPLCGDAGDADDGRGGADGDGVPTDRRGIPVAQHHVDGPAHQPRSHQLGQPDDAEGESAQDQGAAPRGEQTTRDTPGVAGRGGVEDPAGHRSTSSW